MRWNCRRLVTTLPFNVFILQTSAPTFFILLVISFRMVSRYNYGLIPPNLHSLRIIPYLILLIFPFLSPSFQISGIVLALWAVGAVLTGDYLASDHNDVVPETTSLNAVVGLLSPPFQVINESKYTYSPPNRQPYWLPFEVINQCRLCLRFHGISWSVTPWAHQEGLVGGSASQKSGWSALSHHGLHITCVTPTSVGMDTTQFSTPRRISSATLV